MNTVLIVATILGGLTAVWYFWDKLRAWIRGGSNVSQHDIELYKKYKELFIDNGAAEYYRQLDFLSSFQEMYWRPLAHYVDTWVTVEHEFVDRRLNEVHKKVYVNALKLATSIAMYTVPIGEGGSLRSVKPDYLPPGPTPEYIKNEARQIDSLVPNFVKAHQVFVRLANRKLC